MTVNSSRLPPSQMQSHPKEPVSFLTMCINVPGRAPIGSDWILCPSPNQSPRPGESHAQVGQSWVKCPLQELVGEKLHPPHLRVGEGLFLKEHWEKLGCMEKKNGKRMQSKHNTGSLSIDHSLHFSLRYIQWGFPSLLMDNKPSLNLVA